MEGYRNQRIRHLNKNTPSDLFKEEKVWCFSKSEKRCIWCFKKSKVTYLGNLTLCRKHKKEEQFSFSLRVEIFLNIYNGPHINRL